MTQPAGLPSRVIAVALEYGKDWGKARRPSPKVANSSDDNLLPDKELDSKSKGHKRDYTSPADIVVVDDDDGPLSSSTQKTLAKKAKTYTASEQDTFDRLSLQLKSEGQNCQYSKELADLIKYQN